MPCIAALCMVFHCLHTPVQLYAVTRGRCSSCPSGVCLVYLAVYGKGATTKGKSPQDVALASTTASISTTASTSISTNGQQSHT